MNSIVTITVVGLLGLALGSCGNGGPNTPPPPPTAFDQDTSIGVNTQLFDVLDAENVDHSTCTFVIVTAALNGTIALNPDNGNVTYTPNTNYMGLDNFYWAVDDQWGNSNVAIYTIGVGVAARRSISRQPALAQR